MGFTAGDVAQSDAKQMHQAISISKVENLYLGCCGSRGDSLGRISTPTWWYDPKAHGPTVRIFCRRDANYSLTVRGESVVLAPTDPKDDRQYWIKDNRLNSKVRDEEGHPSFALVNKETGQAIKHSFGHRHPVRLIQYNPSYADESVLWTESNDVNEGFREITMVNNVGLHFDALSGVIADGTVLGLHKRNHADNQRWKMVPYSNKEEGEKQFPALAGDGNLTQLTGSTLSNLSSSSSGAAYPLIPRYSTPNWYDAHTAGPTMRIFCRAGEGYSLAVRGENVVLELANPGSDYQHWIKDTRCSSKVQDEEGKPAFALVNKATGEALKHSFGFGHYVRLIPYNPDYLDESVLWTESDDLGGGFHAVRMVNNTALLFDSLNSAPTVRNGNPLGLWKWNAGDNQRWMIVPYCMFLLISASSVLV